MSTWDGISSSIIANRFGNVYVKDYMDISGRLFVRRDASFNNRLFVMNDASFMGNLYVEDYLTNLKFRVIGDTSLNRRLMVAKDVSFQANLATASSFTLVAGNTTITSIPINNTSSNKITRGNTLGFSGTAYNAYVNQSYSGNYFLSARIVNISDDSNYGSKRIGFYTSPAVVLPYFGFLTDNPNTVSIYFNGILQSYTTTYVANDTLSLERRSDSVTYYKNNSVLTRYYAPNSVSLYPVITMQYRGSIDTIDLISFGTVSKLPTYNVNGNLIANTHFRVNNDASLNGNVNVNKDISCNGNISIVRNLIVAGNLAVKNYTTSNIINTTTTNYQLVIAEDLSLNGRLLVSSDTSLNGNLFVGKDISCNGTLISTITYILEDISINGVTVGNGSGGSTNTIFGNLALANNITGINNTAVGYAALRQNTGSHNSAAGYNALVSNTTGTYNSAFGSNALSSNTTGSCNTALGYNAGSANVDGSYNTFIGYNANANAGNYSYSTAIGANSLITGSNQIVLGTSSETVVIPARIRHVNTPIIYYTASGQTLAANASTTILFSLNPYTGTYTNIGYNSTNGYFTNNAGYTIGATVTASIRSNGLVTSTGYMVSIVSSAYGTISSSGIYGSTSGTSSANCTATFPIASGEYFYVRVKNTTATAGSTLYGIGGNIYKEANIMIRVF